MATDIGKVGIVMKGAWNSSATYEVLDAVSYNNGTYIAKQDVPANTAPTNTTYWQVALDPSIIGSTPFTIPGVNTITAALAKTSNYIYNTANGGGSSLCYKNGLYFIHAKHNTDTSAYYLGIVWKAAGVAPVITQLAANKISIRATNEGGTIAFNYNDSGLGGDGTSISYLFLGL